MGGACSTHGEKRGAYRVWVGKTEGKGPRGRPRHKLEDNIKMDLKRLDGRHGLDWIYQSQDCCECGNEPASSLKCMEYLVLPSQEGLWRV